MTKNEYFEMIRDSYDAGEIEGNVYDFLAMTADDYYDEEEEDDYPGNDY